MQRTHTCGELREEDTGQEVELIGWAQRIRDHGSKKFIDLRDREGITQIVLDTEETETFTEADEIGKEYLIRISGKVEKRLEGTENEELETGYIEVHATDYEIVSDSELPPFSLDEEKREKIKESLRFKHRYLDLRNRAKQENIIHRHRFFQALRRFLSEEDYIEVETPFLTKSTPEGARDFIVPSRNFPGNLYALPQSPQLFKQLLMVAGFEKYFQIVKCFRDEDTRSDRQPEFTQLDIEVSFRDQDEFLEKIEEMVKYALKETYDEDIDIPFRRMRYEEAMDRYGSDRPDLRFEMQLHDISEIVEDSDFGIFSDTVEDGGVVKAVRLEEENLSNNYIKKLETAVKDEGAPGLLRIEVGDELEGPMLKHIEEDILESIVDEMEAEKGDTIFMVAGEKEIVNPALGRLRRKLGEDFELYDDESLEFVWIMDFPMFGLDGEGLKSEHHPFTAPFDPEKFMNTDEGEKDKFAKMDADAYDLVLNGYEIGGGSKRIHDMEMQRKVFRLLELNDEEVEDRFGWFLEAFNYSAPPHRGIAFGLDRILMIMEDEENIREVIPFPKSKTGYDYLTDAPSRPREGQLEDLGIEIKEEFKNYEDEE